MFKKIDFRVLAMSLILFSLGTLTMMGITQKYIHFAGASNEMGFSLLAFWVGAISLLAIKK
tara:strand:- start:3314 stop:3496 length:183 start_codon:yes stop_codon:yes gene_type:complete